MNEKQQQLLFDKGITNVPSDALCSDNALEESLGMVYDNGEHRVIQKPIIQMGTGTAFSASILYIHKFNNEKRYIFVCHVRGETDVLKWGEKDVLSLVPSGDSSLSSIDISDLAQVHVTSVGKTLVISDRNGLHYFLWKDDSYLGLGPIPVPKPEYQMCKFEANANPKVVKNPIDAPDYSNAEYWYTERKDVVKHTLSFEGVFKTNSDFNKGAMDPEGEGSDEPWPEKYQEQYNNLVLGCYSANKKAVAQNNCFCNPFFVRIALELYDGSYYHIGAPMLMLPSVDSNSWVRLSGGYNFTLYTICRQLAVKQSIDYTNWSDIVKDVVLFVSDDIDVNETTMDIPIYEHHGEFEAKSFCSSTIGGSWSLETINQINAGTDIHRDTQGKLRYHFNPLKPRKYADMDASIEGVSVFYKLCSLGIKSVDWMSTREKIEKHTLVNITTQEHLENDDYFSACPIKGSFAYAYNGRLNIANVLRGFFGGFNFSNAYTVDIDINGSTKRISHNETVSSLAQSFYFFYPDSRAKKVGTLDLKEHPGLNGAYYFRGLEDIISYPNEGSGTSSQQIINLFDHDFESLPNTLITSEVNNPFSFFARGYNSIGTGSIIGISSTTQALSEGQFGQYPLLVFSTDGIWAMQVNNEGIYSSAHPMSREVCNNPRSITQTDGAVFFTSDKGLMVVAGNLVKCVSDQLSGKESGNTYVVSLGHFNEYLKTCFIAYDYRDSLLWIFDGSGNVSNYCWIYSIKSGTFGKYNCGYISAIANDYPDFLLSSAQYFLSLTDRSNINNDVDILGQQNTYSATIISRPMKLENALALKSIMQIKHIHDIENLNGTGANDPALTFKMYGSNNLKNWVQLQSLRGVPWKYYRFEYDFTKLKATDRFSGTMLVTQERRKDKLR